jgi:hypothetical protein
MKRKTLPWPPPHIRLTAQGTRVVILKNGPPHAPGVISELRTQTNLKSYVVTCDDGQVVYASGCDLALEADARAVPLAGRKPE